MKIMLHFWLIILISGLMVIGCNDGEVNNNEESQLTVSLLKGKFKYAIVNVYDSEENELWQGRSDDAGQVTIPIIGTFNNEVIIKATADHQTRMPCDATSCSGAKTNKTYPFGDDIAPDDLEDLMLSTFFLVPDSSQPQRYDAQMNSLTTMAMNIIENSQEETLEIDANYYSQRATSASQVIIRALGLTTPADLDLFNSKQIDLNETHNLQGISDSILQLSMVNASLSTDTSQIKSFSEALIALSVTPNDVDLQNQVETLQKKIAIEAENVANLPTFTDVPANIQQILHNAAIAPLDFEAISDVIDISNPSVPDTVSSIKAITASGTHWSPTENNLRTDNWWWFSKTESTHNEWIQFDFDDPIQPSYMGLGMNKQFQGYNLRLQGRNLEDAIWTDINDTISAYIKTHGVTDEKNTTSVVAPLTMDEPYTSFRLLSPPTNAIRLEYICLYSEQPSEEDSCAMTERLTPDSVSVSSSHFSPDNTLEKASTTPWISALATQEIQWLTIKYFESFIATELNLKANALYLGASPEIQGLDENEEWQTLMALNVNILQEQADDAGFISVTLPITNTQAYQQYRYFSEPTSFIWIESLELVE